MIITAIAIARCSAMTGNTAFSCDRASKKLNKAMTIRPQHIDASTAVSKGSNKSGTAKLIATKNFVRNVEKVAAQMRSLVDSGFASSAIWMPSASDIASATAITRIPPSTATTDSVPACNPAISPTVVMTPDVAPKKMPVRAPSFVSSRFKQKYPLFEFFCNDKEANHR